MLATIKPRLREIKKFFKVHTTHNDGAGIQTQGYAFEHYTLFTASCSGSMRSCQDQMMLELDLRGGLRLHQERNGKGSSVRWISTCTTEQKITACLGSASSSLQCRRGVPGQETGKVGQGQSMKGLQATKHVLILRPVGNHRETDLSRQ